MYFLQIEGKTLHQQKDYDLLIAALTLLQRSGTKPTVPLTYACRRQKGKSKEQKTENKNR